MEPNEDPDPGGAAAEPPEYLDYTLPGQRPGWYACLTGPVTAPARATGSIGQPFAHFHLEARGPGVRHLERAGRVALVAGWPRPKEAPAAHAAVLDPALALLRAYDDLGLSGLRRIEGAWALLIWDTYAGELLLAVDRLGRCEVCVCEHPGGLHFAGSADELARRIGISADPARATAWKRSGTRPLGETLYLGVTRLLPGTHLALRADGARRTGSHGEWRVERFDRRAWPLVLGEFEERLKSVLRLLAERAELALLAEHPWSAALLATALSRLPDVAPSLLWVPGLSPYRRSYWEILCSHFGYALPEAAAEPQIDAAAGSEDRAAVRRRAEAALGGVAARWARSVQGAQRPLVLVSGAGFEQALPRTSGAWRRLDFWTPWAEDRKPLPGEVGERLAEGLGSQWKPRLDQALAGQAIEPAWPFLDETVSHFLANVPPGLRGGRLGSAPFRTRLLRELLPPGLYRALHDEGLR